SSPEGVYVTQFENLGTGLYTASISATSQNLGGTCEATFSIATANLCATGTKSLTVSGYALDSEGNPIDSGNVTVTITETEDTISADFTGGYWTATMNACIVSDVRYTLGIRIVDESGKSSYSQTSFVSP
ncbi:MAG: hypothetical protein V1944_02895, partial [Candidatus Aenigmatarchaeota archaeon]